VQLVRRRAIA